ncbi:DUF2846 domain-containing protein [Dasania marina]|uniref:DUF2846 domain-containing protein n=1 Tax=Dasania marina TaxID=471499 RepID=UPI0030D8F563|tara:strand:+ start:6861 stop:7361 length:501 start_codon:yes stop_codon:yes gene_type:complete
MNTFKYIALSLFLCGCNATGPLFTEKNKPDEGKALIYIYRPAAFTASVRRVKITINNKEVIQLKNQGFTNVELNPGSYIIKQNFNYLLGDPPFLKKERVFSLNVNSNETHFVGFFSDSDVDGMSAISTGSGAMTSANITFRYGFGLVEEPIALQHLKKCRYQPNTF